MSKKCKDCGEIKTTESFTGLSRSCKQCRVIRQTKYTRTFDGFVTVVYANQRQASKTRGHKSPKYTKEELAEYLKKNDKFKELFNEWEKNGYKKEERPSLDRLNQSFGYSFNNIVVKTWHENLNCAREQRKKGLDGTSKPIVKYDKNSLEMLAIYSTLRSGARKNNLKMQNISKCCHNVVKTCGGYVWKFL